MVLTYLRRMHAHVYHWLGWEDSRNTGKWMSHCFQCFSFCIWEKGQNKGKATAKNWNASVPGMQYSHLMSSQGTQCVACSKGIAQEDLIALDCIYFVARRMRECFQGPFDWHSSPQSLNFPRNLLWMLGWENCQICSTLHSCYGTWCPL